MAPLTKGRNTPRADGDVQSYPVLASTKIYAGALVALDASGWAIPGATATTLTAVGRADEDVDNSAGANGALRVKVRFGAFRYENSSGGDLIAAAEIGDDCYIVDDQTVAKTNGSSTRSVAGRIVQVDAQGVWVDLRIS